MFSDVTITIRAATPTEHSYTLGVPSVWSKNGTVRFEDGHVTLTKEVRAQQQSMRLKVVAPLKGGRNPVFICDQNGSLVAVTVVRQHAGKGG